MLITIVIDDLINFTSFLNGKCGIDINSVVEEATKLNDTAWCHQREVVLRFITIQVLI